MSDKYMQYMYNHSKIFYHINRIIYCILFIGFTAYIYVSYQYNFLQIIIMCMIYAFTAIVLSLMHELGHFVFGAFFNAQFMLFSAGGFRVEIINKKKVIVISLSDIRFQCSMFPQKKRLSYFMYLIGGVIANAAIAVFAIIFSYCTNGMLLKHILTSVIIVSLFKIFINLIPAFYKGIPNDMMNILIYIKYHDFFHEYMYAEYSYRFNLPVSPPIVQGTEDYLSSFINDWNKAYESSVNII